MKLFANHIIATVAAATALSTSLSYAETVPADYSKKESWLCHAERENLGACDINLDTTVVAANGALAREAYKADANPAIDCFYVYPTVSQDKSGNSDMVANEEEYNVIAQQFARYGSQCRLFAPLYRQVSLGALRSGLGGGGDVKIDREMPMADVRAAWNDYLQNHNHGRGVILVGHSQGSGVLTRLIQQDIEGKPVQKQIISAHLIGTRVQVPEGKAVGGSFKHMPLCTKGEQTGCIITFASYRSDLPPSPRAMFAGGANGSVSACTNPAQLAKDSNDLHAYMNAGTGRTATDVWATNQKPIETPFASVPGMLSGECVVKNGRGYFEVTVNGDPNDPRVDDIVGDVITADGQRDAGWGLHVIDVNLAMGDLLKVAEKQKQAYLKK